VPPYSVLSPKGGGDKLYGNNFFSFRRLLLTGIFPSAPSAITYSDANGNFTFSGVSAGQYQITADLNECTTAPYNKGYSFRYPQAVSVIAGNVTNSNFAPSLLNAAS
jgi:hypothetical protein